MRHVPRLGAIVVAILLIGSACSDDGGAADPGPSVEGGVDATISLEVLDGDLVGGSRQEDIDIGDSVEVIVSGNSDDQVHIHGYDRYVDLVDGEGSVSFDALIPGTFEIELEASGRLLIRMTVS